MNTSFPQEILYEILYYWDFSIYKLKPSFPIINEFLNENSLEFEVREIGTIEYYSKDKFFSRFIYDSRIYCKFSEKSRYYKLFICRKHLDGVPFSVLPFLYNINGVTMGVKLEEKITEKMNFKEIEQCFTELGGWYLSLQFYLKHDNSLRIHNTFYNNKKVMENQKLLSIEWNKTERS